MTTHGNARWGCVILFLLMTVIVPDLLLAGLEGKRKKGVYTSPDKNFSVEVPRGAQVEDGYSQEHMEGFVEIVDGGGYFNAIWYSPFEPDDELAEFLAVEANAAKFFAGYFRDVIMPWIFLPISDNSAILSESTLSFDGDSAYLFLVNVPGASGLTDMNTNMRYDGRRATLLFNRCGYTYIVTHELVAGLNGVSRVFEGDEVPDTVIKDDMADGKRALRALIDNIRFSGCPE